MAISTKQSEPSVIQLVRSAAADTTELVRQQIELTKTEVRQNVKTAGSSYGMLAAGGAVLGLGGVFLLVTIAYVLVQLGLPTWAGFGIVTLFLMIVGAILVILGRKRSQRITGTAHTMAALESTKSTLRG